MIFVNTVFFLLDTKLFTFLMGVLFVVSCINLGFRLFSRE